MKRVFVFAVMLAAAHAEDDRRPLYKYRYQTEDVMKTAASNIPLHGYHVVEGGYYPEERFSGSRGGYGIDEYSSGIGQGGLSSTGYGGSGVGSRIQSGNIGFGGSNIGYGGSSIGFGGSGGRFGIRGGGGDISLGGGQIGRLGGVGIGGGGIGIGAGRLGGFGIGGSSIGVGGSDIGIEGGNIGLGRGYTGGIGRGGIGISGGGIGIGGLGGHHGHGGEVLDKKAYSGEEKNLNDESYEKINGKKGEEVNQGENGFSHGKVGLQNSKGDSGYYNDEEGGKKVVEDGKEYKGGEFYNHEGKNADEKKRKSGHKKGHVIKGFKSSHHKDENGKTEEYYDEAHDEGDNYNVEGQSGKFGKDSEVSYKGGHDNSQFNADERKKQGHYDAEEYVNKNNADQGQYGQKKYTGNGQVYGINNGIDQQSLLGHQEASRIFKHYPYHVPFYH